MKGPSTRAWRTFDGTLRMKQLFSITFFLACVAMVQSVSAAPPRSAPPSTPAAQPLAQTPDAVTRHTVTVDGRALHYTARAGTITLRDQNGKPTAEVFYTSYTTDARSPETRPVTFVYYGVSGSPTMWLGVAIGELEFIGRISKKL